MSRYELDQVVRFRTTYSTVADDVDGRVGLVVAITPDKRATVAVNGFEIDVDDDELDLET